MIISSRSQKNSTSISPFFLFLYLNPLLQPPVLPLLFSFFGANSCNAIFSLSHFNTIPEASEAVTSIPEAVPIPSTDSRIVRDIDFYFKLNHTRLLTSKLLWRPELKEELLVSSLY